MTIHTLIRNGIVGRAYAPAIVYQTPIVINDALISARGSNIFEGNWRNDSFTDNQGAAVRIDTNAAVILRNSRIVAQQYGVRRIGATGGEPTGGNVTVQNCVVVVRNTTSAGVAAGYGIRLWEPVSLVAENNTFIGGGGISARGSASYVNPTTTVRIRYNRCLDLMGLRSDGAGGYVLETGAGDIEKRQFTQLDHLHVPTGAVEIAWNETINAPFLSRPEDTINIYGLRCTVSNPALIHDNYIQGGSPTRPYDVGMGGTGIVCEKDARYVQIEDNQIVSYGNAAITLVNSDNCHALRNRAVGDGKVNGQTSFSRREAFLLYNADASPQTTNCSFEDNLHAWAGPGGNLAPAYAPEAGSNGNFLSGMTSLGTPDEAMEAAEWTAWVAKKTAAGVVVGSSLSV